MTSVNDAKPRLCCHNVYIPVICPMTMCLRTWISRSWMRLVVDDWKLWLNPRFENVIAESMGDKSSNVSLIGGMSSPNYRTMVVRLNVDTDYCILVIFKTTIQLPKLAQAYTILLLQEWRGDESMGYWFCLLLSMWALLLTSLVIRTDQTLLVNLMYSLAPCC